MLKVKPSLPTKIYIWLRVFFIRIPKEISYKRCTIWNILNRKMEQIIVLALMIGGTVWGIYDTFFRE